MTTEQKMTKEVDTEIMKRTTTSRMQVNEVYQPAEGPPLILVRADVLVPMLVYLRKFFKKIEATNRNTPSRFVDPDDFTLTIAMKGFTPEDFNGLMSLQNSMGSEMTALLDAAGAGTPQMSRPKAERDQRAARRFLGDLRRDPQEVLKEAQRADQGEPVRGDMAVIGGDDDGEV